MDRDSIERNASGMVRQVTSCDCGVRPQGQHLGVLLVTAVFEMEEPRFRVG